MKRFLASFALWLILVAPCFAACGFGSSIGGGQCRGFLTTTGTNTWTVPSDWSNTNKIEVIGGGASGALSNHLTGNSSGGGGGAYTAVSNLTSLSANSTVDYNVGTGGANVSSISNGNGGGDTYLCSATTNCATIAGTSVIVGAKGGSAGAQGSGVQSGGAGGAASGCKPAAGATCNSGGAGGTSNGSGGTSESGGGGAAGLNGNGNNGASVNNTAGNGGSGDAGSGGSAGTGGASGGTGGNGAEWDASHGSGGGGGAASTNNGGPGGNYGGGGGGANDNGINSGAGIQGLIVITYTSSGGATVIHLLTLTGAGS